MKKVIVVFFVLCLWLFSYIVLCPLQNLGNSLEIKSLIPYANAATRVSVTLDGRQLDEGSKVLEDEGKKVILKFKVDVTGLSGDLEMETALDTSRKSESYHISGQREIEQQIEGLIPRALLKNEKDGTIRVADSEYNLLILRNREPSSSKADTLFSSRVVATNEMLRESQKAILETRGILDERVKKDGSSQKLDLASNLVNDAIVARATGNPQLAKQLVEEARQAMKIEQNPRAGIDTWLWVLFLVIISSVLLIGYKWGRHKRSEWE